MSLDLTALTEIPGTIVFTPTMARIGFQLNQFCMSLMASTNRTRFKANEAAYLREWALSDAASAAVLARDYARMMQLGGNIYFLAKIGATDGLPFINVAASMSGMSLEAYRNMMLAGGRSPQEH